MSDSTEEIISQYEKYISILSKVSNPEAVSKLADSLGQRLVLSPRGQTEKDGGTPGGLIRFSLDVASNSKSMASFYQCGVKSLVKVSLLHELGRVGDLDHDLYIDQESDWHRDKLGQNYKFNDQCSRMGIAHRTLWLSNYFGFSLTMDEYLSILTSQGLHLSENQFYGIENSRNPLITALQSSRGITFQSYN